MFALYSLNVRINKANDLYAQIKLFETSFIVRSTKQYKQYFPNIISCGCHAATSRMQFIEFAIQKNKEHRYNTNFKNYNYSHNKQRN